MILKKLSLKCQNQSFFFFLTVRHAKTNSLLKNFCELFLFDFSKVCLEMLEVLQQIKQRPFKG